MTHPHRRLAPLALALLLGAAGAVQAANFSKGAYDAAKADIESAYKTERETCKSLAGNAKDVCLESAKGREKVAKAQLEFNYSGSEKDQFKLMEARYEARYEVAKERCDDLSGNAKDVCTREAKTDRDKAKAEVKEGKKMSAAAEDAEAAQMKADYQLAKTRCDAMSGEAKDACMASAKARYRENW
ncbi:MAG TPA: hypothetical protein VJN44_16300 [Roseateles sp.]|nr:hypothetical protein [Roseateles sp.]